MKLGYKARRRLSVLLLVIWLPLYIIVALEVLTRLPELPFILQLLIYIFVGFLWVLPFRFVFIGVGRADPAAKSDE